MKSNLSILLILICCLFQAACEPPAKAKLEGGNPPTFSVWSGTGTLWFASFGEYRPDKSLKPSQRWHELWRIEPVRNSSGQMIGKYTDEIGKITYGVPPDGYRQVIPANGQAPALIPGKYYSYSFKTENGMPADGEFEIHDNNAVIVRAPGNCYYTDKDGKEIEVPCRER